MFARTPRVFLRTSIILFVSPSSSILSVFLPFYPIYPRCISILLLLLPPPCLYFLSISHLLLSLLSISLSPQPFLLPIKNPPVALPVFLFFSASLHSHTCELGNFPFILFHPTSFIHVSLKLIKSYSPIYFQNSLSLFPTPATFQNNSFFLSFLFSICFLSFTPFFILFSSPFPLPSFPFSLSPLLPFLA